MPSFSVRNFGCRVNLAESFAWAEAFRGRGLRFEEDWRRSDLLVVNTCTLTGRADRDVRKFFRRIERDAPDAKIVVTGCLAERAPEEFARRPEVELVLGNKEKAELVDRAMALLGAGPGQGRPAARRDETAGAKLFRARGWIKVQDGCDKRCAFCVIPSVRGPSASVVPDKVLAAVAAATARGHREVILTGIDLFSYGDDLVPRTTLAGLVRQVIDLPGLGRVRLSSLDPGRVDEELIALAASNGRLCRHFHLSLQHGSARMLRLMGRAADPEEYRRVLAALSEAVPGAALGADILVGFPGEEEDDFEELKAFLESAPLAYFHVFRYSPRRGTPAAGRRQVPDGVKTMRAVELRRLAAAKNLAFRRSFEGRTLGAVVIDERGRRRAGRAELLTDNFIKVEAAGQAPERELVRVRIVRAGERATEGRIDV